MGQCSPSAGCCQCWKTVSKDKSKTQEKYSFETAFTFGNTICKKLFTFRKVFSPFLFSSLPPFLNKIGVWLMSASLSSKYLIFTSSLRKIDMKGTFPERNQSASDFEAAVISNTWTPRTVSGLTRSLARSQWTHGPGCSPTGCPAQAQLEGLGDPKNPQHKELRTLGYPRQWFPLQPFGGRKARGHAAIAAALYRIIVIIILFLLLLTTTSGMLLPSRFVVLFKSVIHK